MLDRSPHNQPAVSRESTQSRNDTAPLCTTQTIGSPCTVKGYELVSRFSCGAHPRVYLNHAATCGAIISDSDLTLLSRIDDSVQQLAFTRESSIIRNAHLGRGVFSTTGDQFLLIAGSNPGKLLQIEIPALFAGDNGPCTVQRREFPPVSGRHIFSPSGDLLISYPTTGMPMCICWNIVSGAGSLVIRSGDIFKLSGTPTAEGISSKGDTIAIGVRRENGQFGLLVYDCNSTRPKLIDYPNEINQLAFSGDDSVLWVGDRNGYITCYQLMDMASSKLVRLNGTGSPPAPITALRTIGDANQVICGTADGRVYQADLSQHSPTRGLYEIAQIATGALVSLASTPDGAVLLMGFSSGESAIYKRT